MKLEGHKGEVLGLAFHPVPASAHLLASSSFDGTVMVWDSSSPDIPAVALLKGHRLAVTDVVFAGRDGGLAATASADGTAALWDVVTGERLKVLRGHRSHVNAVLIGHRHGFDKSLLRAAWGGRDEVVAAGAADGTLWVWEVADRAVRYRLPGHEGPVNAVAFHATQPVVASGGADKVIFLGELLL